MNHGFKLLICAAALFGAITVATAQNKATQVGGIVELNETVHDFGDVLMSDGPVTCTFTAKNISSKAMVIYNVVSSCGCTDVKWTREPIKPGQSGTITATYQNDEGAFPFDKTLTVYFSDIKQPTILRLKGVSRAKQVPLTQAYGIKFGNLAFQDVEIKGGNLSQGQQKTSQVTVANVGKSPIKVTFADVSDGLSLSLSQNPIPAGETARLSFTISASRNRWGKNYYYFTPVVDGKKYAATVTGNVEQGKTVNAWAGSQGNVDAPGAEAILSDPNPNVGAGKQKVAVYAFTKENFASLTDEQKKSASQIMFKDGSTFDFGKVKAGQKVTATFTVSNTGKFPLKIYKVDSESRRVNTQSVNIPEVQPGKTATFTITLDTTGLPKGETSIVVLLTTNAPSRPIVNLFINGWIV